MKEFYSFVISFQLLNQAVVTDKIQDGGWPLSRRVWEKNYDS